jgi:hypothetical protein
MYYFVWESAINVGCRDPEGRRKTKEDLEEVSCGRGTERRKDVDGGEVAGSGQE